MQSVLPQLTTVLLLIHMGFGCCFHHTHTCDASDCTPESSHDSSCHDHHPSSADSAGRGVCQASSVRGRHDEHHSHECSDEACTFVVTRSRVANGIEEVRGALSSMTPGLSGADTATRETLVAGNLGVAHTRSPSPRAHLKLQVLLL